MKRLTAIAVTLLTFHAAGSIRLEADLETKDIWIFRSIDGSGNNVAHTYRGQADTPLIRVAIPGHGDGTDLPRGVPSENDGDGNIEIDEQTLPSARAISNAVHDQNSDGGHFLPSSRNLNQLFFQFGQFLSHDIGLTEPNGEMATGGATGYVGNEWFPILVPAIDPDFPFAEIFFTRSIAIAPSVSSSGRREPTNTITAFIDGSNIYGSDEIRANRLRAFVGGRLLVIAGGFHGDLLPRNVFGEENANPLHQDPGSLFLAGDVRANEQVGLTAMHTLFVREHNRLAREIAEKDFAGANLSDPFIDNLIYERARAVVGAILQKIAYHEWLPVLLGDDRLGSYEGYKPGVDPQLSNVFSTAAFRIGHTMLPPELAPELSSGILMPLPLRDAFFNPTFVSAYGIDPILRGLSKNPQQEIDRFIVDDVRNFLFGPIGLDLAALNIQRGRDHCLPSYNGVRQSFGLPPALDFADVTPDDTAAAALRSAYGFGRARDIDVWTGGMAEAPLPGSSLGPTFTAIFIDQFSRLRDGDRFFFQNRQIYSPELIEAIEATTLADVIRRNSGLLASGDLNKDGFFPPGYNPFQVDLRIGRRASLTSHRGNGIYNRGGAGQTQSVRTRRTRPATLFVSIENDGAFTGPIQVRLTGVSRKKLHARVTADTGLNITAAVLRGGYSRSFLPGQIRTIRAQFRARNRRGHTAARPAFHGTSSSSASAGDVVRANLRFR